MLNIRLTGTGVIVTAALATAAWYWHSGNEEAKKKDDTEISKASPPPRTIDTNGGNLEVAVLRVTGDQFTKEDPRYILGIPLGTTKSKLQADVTYRLSAPTEN